jgi:PEP-CTERM motif
MRRHHVTSIACATAALLFTTATASAVPSIYYYPYFAFYGPFTFNGVSGLVVANTIPMINGVNQNGSVFVTASQDVTQSFTAQYTFSLSNPTGDTPNGGDGLAFVIEGDSRGPSALGAGGAQLGYGDNGGGAAIQNSLAVAFISGATNQFELFANTGNTNLDVNSAAFAVQSGSEGDLTNYANPNIVTVNYTAPGIPDPTGLLTVLFDGNSIGLNNVALPASLTSLVGGSTGYFRFSSSSDASNGSDIAIENFIAGAPTPEPGSLALLAVGGLGLTFKRTRRV